MQELSEKNDIILEGWGPLSYYIYMEGPRGLGL